MKAVLVFVCFALIFCSATAAISLQQALSETPEFSFFAAHLQSTNKEVWDLLGDDTTTDSYTVFATVNNGSNVNLTDANTLSYQVALGSYDGTFAPLDTIPTLYKPSTLGSGVSQVIALSNKEGPTNWVINGQSEIRGPSIQARNGWVHGVSAIILIPAIPLNDVFPPNATLVAILKKLNYEIPTSTFVIPSEESFTTLFQTYPLFATYLLKTNTSKANENLQNIINAHLIPPPLLYPIDFPVFNISAPYPTRDSIASIRFTRVANISTFPAELIDNQNTRYPITQPNVLAPNGVGHYFDGLIIPENFKVGIDELLTVQGEAAGLFEALKRLNLTETFLNLADCTIFAPVGSDAIFNTSTVETLLLHVLPSKTLEFTGNYASTSLILGTLGNRPQQVFLSTARQGVNDSFIVKTIDNIPVMNQNPYPAGNGNLIYFIPRVLNLPGPAANTLNNQNFTDFVNLVGYARDNVAYNRNTTTFFAPTNQAISNLQPGVIGYLTLNQSLDVVEAVIGNHIVPDEILYEFPINDTTFYQTLNGGKPISVSNDGQKIVVNGYATVESRSIPTETGVIRIIDEVIIPNGFAFNLSMILEGLGNEKFNKDNYGSYNKFLRFLNATDLLDTLSNDKAEYTLFAPTDEAFDLAVDNFDTIFYKNETSKDLNETINVLTTTLGYHVIFKQDLGNLVPLTNQSITYPVGFDANDTVRVQVNGNPEQISNYQVTLFTKEGNNIVDKGSANLVLNTTTSNKQRIYGINRVLGLEVRPSASPSPHGSSGHKGLTTAEWVLIGIGGAALGLILLLIVAGVVYYLLIRPKSGYRKIN